MNLPEQILLVLMLLLPAGSFAQQESAANRIAIAIKPVCYGQPLKLSKQYYINKHGDTFYIDGFRFYMTNISFSSTDGELNSHLFDATDTATWSFAMNVYGANPAALQFIAGVDSIANTSGANSGDLDPSKGMYWAWNSGYIMAKLEGHSSACKTFHHEFQFHIGGYMPPYNAARKVLLPVPQSKSMPANSIIYLNADAAVWIDDIDLSKVNDIVIPGKAACEMADRYQHMFSIAGTSAKGEDE